MAENVHFKYPNFCLGPQDGTFCSINQDDATTIMRIKNETGGLIADYSLSSNIINELIHLEYVGPSDITEVMDGLTFFTVEKISSSKCIIKRYETRASSNQLNLKQQIVKYTTGLYYYDIRAAAIENYERTFTLHNPGGINYLEISSSSRIGIGTRLFLGPSTDSDNPGAGESVLVTSVVGTTLYFTPNLAYQYVIGNKISFYSDTYLISNLGMGGDTSRGTIFKIDSDNGTVNDVNTNKVYRNVDTARWCVPSQTIAAVAGDNMLFINPYSSYYNWRSMYLNNLEDNNYDTFTIHDVLFEDTANYPIYLLATKKTTRDDSGNRSTEDWGSWYNYIENTLTPYSNSIEIHVEPEAIMIGENDTTTLYVKVIDQFGVGLSGKNVEVSVDSGDLGAVLDPLDGKVTTDINGEASVGYTSGETYEGVSIIKCKTDGSLPATGSQYVWNSIRIFSIITASNYGKLDTVVSGGSGDLQTFAFAAEISSEGMMIARSFFTNPGGDWKQGGAGTSQVPTYLPDLIVGAGEGPVYTFTAPDPPNPTEFDPMPNTIHQVEDFDSEQRLKQLKNYKVLTESVGGVFNYEEPYSILQQIKESYDLQISQLKLSTHTYWVSGTAYDYLWTYTTLDQFIFVQEAVPVFWSEKNPIETNIWLRLRPFAFSLSPSSLKFYVREVWYGGDTGYVDVSSQITTATFDAGGGVLGVEVTYDPSQDFHHNAVVYVFFEIYDTAPSPNRITTNYWFIEIPDYKAPYLENLSPSREQSNVSVDTDIYFEIKDDGAGVDIDSLEITVNSRIIIPTTIVKVSDNYYKVTCTPSTNFFFGKRIEVGVMVDDLSGYNNWLNDRYAFYTVESDDVLFTEFLPGACKEGLSRFIDVSFTALGTGSGVDRDTLRLQVRDKDVTDESNIVPIIYRLG